MGVYEVRLVTVVCTYLLPILLTKKMIFLKKQKIIAYNVEKMNIIYTRKYLSFRIQHYLAKIYTRLFMSTHCFGKVVFQGKYNRIWEKSHVDISKKNDMCKKAI
jgi:hypothetical protein